MIYVSLFSVCVVDQMFWEVMQLRKEMSLAKLGYFKEEL